MENQNIPEKKNRKSLVICLIVLLAVVFIVAGTFLTRDTVPRTRTADREYVTADTVSSKLSANSVSRSYDLAANEAVESVEYETEEAAADTAAGAGSTYEEKIIRTASFTIKTTEYDTDLAELQALVTEVGGRVEYMSTYGDTSTGSTRSADLNLRIPSDKLDEFLAGSREIGTVTAMTEERQDVSDSYYDTQSRLETQQQKLERLQALMASAENVSDLIEIESAIADTQYYIDLYTGRLQNYDSRIEYSTVYVTLRETRTVEMENLSLGERIRAGLEASLKDGKEFLEDMLVFVVSALPWVIVICVIAVIIRLIVKKKRK